ncbi:MAG: class I SAM-dependent methyltransferase [Planctomycetes bacterium]|nr:class I SAM-dependent methyltransferase [Planctomycetota bacterium]
MTLASDWNGETGERWVRNQEDLDAWLRPIGALAIERLGDVSGRTVLDVGCGCGATLIDLAEAVGPTGSVLGIDVSRSMVERARARVTHLPAVEVVLGDAQKYDFGARRFDAVMSRFGVMFFDDTVAGLGHLASFLAPGGLMSFVCWQGLEHNEWASVPIAVANEILGPPEPKPPGEPGPFRFADDAEMRATLERAGLVDVRIDGVVDSRPAGDVEHVVEVFGRQVGPVSRRIHDVDDELRHAVLGSLRTTLTARAVDGMVAFSTAVWCVTARSR